MDIGIICYHHCFLVPLINRIDEIERIVAKARQNRINEYTVTNSGASFSALKDPSR